MSAPTAGPQLAADWGKGLLHLALGMLPDWLEHTIAVLGLLALAAVGARWLLGVVRAARTGGGAGSAGDADVR
ncbi:hypothetical protein ACWCXB_16085 [Streptomyces sp. NPDC001514]